MNMHAVPIFRHLEFKMHQPRMIWTHTPVCVCENLASVAAKHETCSTGTTLAEGLKG